MLGKQAKIVSPATLRRMIAYARKTRHPKRDTVMVLLSVKAGLRACEIAGLQWSMVMTDGWQDQRRRRYSQRHRQTRLGPSHPNASKPAMGFGRAVARTNVRQSYCRVEIEAAQCAPTAS